VAELQTLLYEEKNGVAWVTMNRPQVDNAFDTAMQHELRDTWRALRRNDDVRAVVLTGSGDRAFCSGIDRQDAIASRLSGEDTSEIGHASGSPYMFDDVGDLICPKRNDLWKPVIAAVNGLACGGAFYILGEVDIIIASDNATFFDPHVTYGMVSGFESIHVRQRMPLGETLRLVLLGSHERMSAQRAHEIGYVSEVVPRQDLHERAEWVAERIAEAPELAIQGTVRSVWAAQEMSREQALALAYTYVGMGTTQENLAEGQAKFASGQRPKWRLR
jgi:enoyl-CoA hydratase/carnithine racemase